MKNFNVTIILLLIFFYSVRPSLCTIDEDSKELTNIKNALQKDPDIFQRLVTMDSVLKITITKYYKDSTVEESDVYTLFHVVNIILPCEFSEIMYKYIMFGDNIINKYKTDNKSKKICCTNI